MIDSILVLSIVRKYYVVLKYSMKRCTNFTINDMAKLGSGYFLFCNFSLLSMFGEGLKMAT